MSRSLAPAVGAVLVLLACHGPETPVRGGGAGNGGGGSAGSGGAVDADGDGLSPPQDCDDADGNVHPGAAEVPYDGIDQDCDGSDLTDVDGDGVPGTKVRGGTDCDDEDAGRHPGAPEICGDGIDQDCSGHDVACDDVDRDGDGRSPAQGDCDDNDPTVHPGAAEIPYDGKDDDCSAATTDDDLDGDGFDHLADCDDHDAGIHPGAEDLPYDGIDEDCAEGDLVDVDGDGAVAEKAGGTDCDDDDPASHPGATEIPYDGADDDCNPATPDDDLDGDGYPASVDCDDADPGRRFGLHEIPYDGIDQDCNGTDLTDVDGDGFDATGVGGTDCADGDKKVNPGATELAYNGKDDDCNAATRDDDLDGDGVDHLTDCNDADAARFPGNTEIAYDGIDQDCDGKDLNDLDGDGHASDAAGGDDCNDADATIYPGAKEVVADGIDQSCDGKDAEDHDGDGYGDADAGGDDCDDADAAIHPGADEICDNDVDEDCSGSLVDCLYGWEGVKTDLDPDTLASAWSECFHNAYTDDDTAVPPEDCTGKYLLVGCRVSGEKTLLVAAEASADDVMFDTGEPDNTKKSHNANGVEWYFHSEAGITGSWGFAPGGETVNLNACDVYELNQGIDFASDRLCFQTNDGKWDQGWRCGSHVGNLDGYERVVYQSDHDPG
jgi:hypothetical protein